MFFEEIAMMDLVQERNGPLRLSWLTSRASTILCVLALLTLAGAVVQEIAVGAARVARVITLENAFVIRSPADWALRRNLVACRIDLKTRVDNAVRGKGVFLDGVGQLTTATLDVHGRRSIFVGGTPATRDTLVEGDGHGVVGAVGGLLERSGDGGSDTTAPRAAGDGVTGIFSATSSHVPHEEDEFVFVTVVGEFDLVVTTAAKPDGTGLSIFTRKNCFLVEDVGHGGGALVHLSMCAVWLGEDSRGAQRGERKGDESSHV